MRIFQILVTIQFGDAIGNNTRLLNRAFRLAGIESRIYAINIDNKLLKEKDIFPYNKLPPLQPQDVVIYHMCESTVINADILKMKCKKIAIYHNTTPAHFFTQYIPEMCLKQTESLLEIQSLNNSFDRCIAVSEFNKQDLLRLGYEANKITVIPILLDFEDYKQTPDKNTINTYNDDYTNILFVGRIVPNKKHEDIVRVFAWYKKHINPNSRLILVGSPFGDSYMNRLKMYVKALDLQDVIFPMHVSFSEILAYYSIADIFLCMSEHEGFCVPLVEAMMFNVPIVAYNSTAIPYTLGESGVLVDEKNPVLISKIINSIVNNDDIKQEIIKGQQERLRYFDSNKIFNQIQNVIQQVREIN